MTRGRSRDRMGPALVVAGAGVVAGAAIGGALARRRRQPEPASEDSAAIARRLLEEPWRDLGVVDELVSPDYVGTDPGEPEPARGPEGFRATVARYRAAFPDIAVTVDEQICDGRHVASRWTARGTQRGEIAGIAPTGRQVTVSGFTTTRIEDGRVVEAWTSWDRLGLLVQLGAVSEPARAS